MLFPHRPSAELQLFSPRLSVRQHGHDKVADHHQEDGQQDPRVGAFGLQRIHSYFFTATQPLQENFIKMAEIQRDLGSSYEAGLLSVPGREFIREGCLRKLSRKGYQQRMFFLVSD